MLEKIVKIAAVALVGVVVGSFALGLINKIDGYAQGNTQYGYPQFQYQQPQSNFQMQSPGMNMQMQIPPVNFQGQMGGMNGQMGGMNGQNKMEQQMQMM